MLLQGTSPALCAALHLHNFQLATDRAQMTQFTSLISNYASQLQRGRVYCHDMARADKCMLYCRPVRTEAPAVQQAATQTPQIDVASAEEAAHQYPISASQAEAIVRDWQVSSGLAIIGYPVSTDKLCRLCFWQCLLRTGLSMTLVIV